MAGQDESPKLELQVERQPDETTCGPTCLHAIYRYWGDDVPLAQVVAEVPRLDHGGTLAVMLGTHALRRGYRVRLVTFNLELFDPTWFAPGAPPLAERLAAQMGAKPRHAHVQGASPRYLAFLAEGGRVEMADLSRALVRTPLQRGVPILTGLSSTFLYRTSRDHPVTGLDDDAGGVAQGHFVVLHGYERRTKQVVVADPWFPNPVAPGGRYVVGIDRAISAILLGVLTDDANLLLIEPPGPAGPATEDA